MEKTAIIITGNPALIRRNARAAEFYLELQAFLEELGYAVATDPGKAQTIPPVADLWVGHSKGSDRLRFAPQGTRAIGIGVPRSDHEADFPIINHHSDAMTKRTFAAGAPAKGEPKPDDSFHYVLDEGMRSRLRELILGK